MTKPTVTDAMVMAAHLASRNAPWPYETPFDPLRAAIAAAIEASGILEENARLRADLDIWMSVFPDIAPENVLPDRSTLEAENARLRESLRLYGDRIAMANAPPHLQQEIDRALDDQHD
jgi:hypothetical protein